MKTRISFSILVLLLFSGCTEYGRHCLSVLVDKTEMHTAIADLSGSKLLNHIANAPKSGALVSIGIITDKRYNKAYDFILEPDNNIFNGTHRRKKLWKHLIDTIDNAIENIRKEPTGIERSAIFESAASELNKLRSCQDCKTLTLLIASDMRQFSHFFNSYDPAFLSRCKANQVFFDSLLDSNCPIEGSLKGVSVVIVHQPQSIKEDEAFYHISQLYTSYLKQKGASITIKTTF